MVTETFRDILLLTPENFSMIHDTATNIVGIFFEKTENLRCLLSNFYPVPCLLSLCWIHVSYCS